MVYLIFGLICVLLLVCFLSVRIKNGIGRTFAFIIIIALLLLIFNAVRFQVKATQFQNSARYFIRQIDDTKLDNTKLLLKSEISNGNYKFTDLIYFEYLGQISFGVIHNSSISISYRSLNFQLLDGDNIILDTALYLGKEQFLFQTLSYYTLDKCTLEIGKNYIIRYFKSENHQLHKLGELEFCYNK